MRRRWLIIASCAAYAALLAWLATFIMLLLALETDEWQKLARVMFSPWEWEIGDPLFWMVVGLPIGVMVASQAMFLLPLVRVRQPMGGRARSLRLSMVMAGFVAAVLTFGLASGVVGLLQLLESMRIVGGDPADADIADNGIAAGIVILFGVLGWVFWSVALLRFSRRRQGRGAINRALGLLLGGTIAEVLVVLPLDIMIRRRTDCYCGTGSFWSLTMSAWALLWLTGPGIFIAVFSRRRHPWWETHCEGCGYEKGPSPGAKCPECGCEWNLQRRSEAVSSGAA